jgi:hypothetical protein
LTEDALQKQVAGFLNTSLGQDAVWWHTPNGGSRNKVEAAKLKGMGVKPGVPDVLIFWPAGCMAIELKSDAGRVQPSQAEMMRALEVCGFYVAVCRSLNEVQDALRAARVPMRGRVAA